MEVLRHRVKTSFWRDEKYFDCLAKIFIQEITLHAKFIIHSTGVQPTERLMP
jgi:hypothetical protein